MIKMGKNRYDYSQAKELVKKSIVKKYGSVLKFSKTEEVKSLDINPSTLRVVLSDNGKKSYKIILKLAQFLGLGILKREVRIVRLETFYFE